MPLRSMSSLRLVSNDRPGRFLTLPLSEFHRHFGPDPPYLRKRVGVVGDGVNLPTASGSIQR
jgi:hypothetical protein